MPQWWPKGFTMREPVPATPSAADPQMLVAQARENATWWRAELVAGRLPINWHSIEALIRDLEMAGGMRG